MAPRKLKLPLPRQCPHCKRRGTVHLQQIIKGTAVLLNWYCTRCEKEWPIVAGDDLER